MFGRNDEVGYEIGLFTVKFHSKVEITGTSVVSYDSPALAVKPDMGRGEVTGRIIIEHCTNFQLMCMFM